jgi:hypothetical protein
MVLQAIVLGRIFSFSANVVKKRKKGFSKALNLMGPFS